MVRRRSGNSFSKILKDYMVPIIGLIVIGLIVFVFFHDSNTVDTQSKIKNENQVGITIKLDSDVTEAYIVYPGGTKKKIETETVLYKGENIFVKEGSVALSLPSFGDFKLNKNGDIGYTENGDFLLGSSDFWVDAKEKMTINMKYAKVFVSQNTHLSLSQNEMGSSIYILSGSAEVRNLAGVSSVLGAGQKILISSLDSNKEDFDIASTKENIDDFFKTTDWFIKNNGASYVNNISETSGTSSGTSLKMMTGAVLTSDNISFSNLTDNAFVSSPKIDIEGTYKDENITNIKVNGISAIIDREGKTFQFKGINVGGKENDLVFKVYDDNQDLISKFIYVVYYQGGTDTPSSVAQNSNAGFTVKNYSVDGSKFTFSAPTTKDTFTTTETFVTIKGEVLAKGVAKVSVNDYPLGSFNGTTWRYHADVNYNNLKEGTNIYEIKYFDINEKIIYQNTFTIIKKNAGSSNSSNTVTNN